MNIEQIVNKRLRDFKPTFYGFTGGIRAGESMAEFVKRVNKEGGR